MKIVHVIFCLQYGGAETMLVDIVNQQAINNDVSLLIVNDDYSNELLQTIDNKVSIKRLGRRKSKLDFLSFFKSIRLIEQINPDVIHCHDCSVILFTPFWKYKTVLTVHAMSLPLKGVNLYSRVVAISNAVKEDVYTRKHVDTSMIYNSVKIHCIKQRQPHALKEKVKIVQVGRLYHEVKGQHLLIEAVALLCKQSGMSIHLDFMGDGPSRKFLQQLVQEKGLEDVVRFIGEVDRSYIYEHLCDYDLLVQPSLTEGFGLTIVEAMAAKLPVLVSDISAPMELIQDGKYGFSFESGKSENLAKRLDSMIAHYNALGEKVNKTYDYCMNTFSVESMVDSYLKLYSSLCR